MSLPPSSNTIRHYAHPNDLPRNYTYDVPHNQSKVTVWVGMIGNNTLIGPHFFQGNVTSQAYLDMINTVVIPELHRLYGQGRHGSVPRVWWCQDGAPAHRAVRVRDRLQEAFPGRVIGMGHPVEWPARSPDLTPLDFCLWGYLKQRVFHIPPPRDLEDMKTRIRNELRALRRTRIVRRAVLHMAERAQTCLNLDGHQVEGRSARP